MSESLYLARNSSETISIGGIVMFDTVMFNSGGISYSPATGVITFTQKGTYHINWWVASQSVGNSAMAVLTLLSTGGGSYIGDSPLQKGVVTGLGLFNVTTAPATLTLVNLSSGNLYLTSAIPVKAMISINMETAAGTSDTMLDFEYRQLAHILSQIITLYPTATLRVYSPGFYDIDGTPTSLYTSPEATGAGIFSTTFDPDFQSIALNTIMAFRTGTGTDYNESITYLSPTFPLPVGWDTNIITALHDYLYVGEAVDIYWGMGNNTSGFVYKNEYGMLVITADMNGTEPYFILPTSSLIIITPAITGSKMAKADANATKTVTTDSLTATAKVRKGLVKFKVPKDK